MPAPTAAESEVDSVAQTTQLSPGRATSPDVEEAPQRASSRPGKATGRKRWRKTAVLSVGAVALVGLVVGGILWSRRGVVKVQTGKVQRQDLSSVATASGEIKPKNENQANVNAQTFGRIEKILVKEGDHVKEGQLLLRTESVQQAATVDAQAAAVKTARADIDAMQATVQSSAASLKTAQADLQTAQANLQRAKEDYSRGQQLLEDNLIAQQVFDQRLNDYKVAQANLEAGQARVAQQKALYQQAVFNLDMARARLAQNKAQLVSAEDQRRKTEYYSPLDGIVTALPVHEGENVVPGLQNQPGSLLYQVSDLSVITAEVKVDETDIINVRLGQPAEVLIDAFPNKAFKGQVTEIGQSAVGRTSGLTSGQSATTTEEAKDFKVVVTLDNPPPNLRPGLSTTAKITTATRQGAVTVPIQALTVRMRRELEVPSKDSKGMVQAATQPTNPSGTTAKDKGKEEIQGVFVIRKGKAVFVAVETGIMGTTDVEILKGVQPSDEIVTGPFSVLRTLKNFTKVKVDNTPAKPAGAGS